MKETNSLEMQLRSWEPRAPSQEVKRRLFPASPARSFRGSRSMQWLAPVAACGLLMAMILNQLGPDNRVGGSPANVLTVAVSNQASPAMIATGFAASPSNRFEWTNVSASTSSVSSFLPGQVN